MTEDLDLALARAYCQPCSAVSCSLNTKPLTASARPFATRAAAVQPVASFAHLAAHTAALTRAGARDVIDAARAATAPLALGLDESIELARDGARSTARVLTCLQWKWRWAQRARICFSAPRAARARTRRNRHGAHGRGRLRY